MRYVKYFLNYKFLVYAGFLTTLALIVVFLEEYTLHYDPWILGDWVINYYDGGFKRRGLLGTLFFIIQDTTGIKLTYLVFTTQLILYTLFFYIYYLIVRHKTITFGYFLLIFSPFFLLFYPNDTAAIGRKEILLFVLYAYLIYNIRTNKLSVVKEHIIILLLAIISLMHELTFFFIPYFLFSIYNHSKKGRDDQLRILIYSSIMILLLTVIFIFGNKINSGHSLEILKARGVVFRGGGILKFKRESFEIIAANINGYYLYFFSLLYQIILFRKFLSTVRTRYRKNYIYMGVFCFFFSLPIFFLAVDWGRWLHIHFVLFSIALTSALEDSDEWKNSDIMKKDVTIKNSLWILLNLSIAMKHTVVGITVSKFLIVFH